MSGAAPADLPGLPARPEDAHKGALGRVAVVGGSLRMPGAVALAGEAALRAGAGIVEIALPAPAQALAVPLLREAIWLPLPADADGFVDASAVEELGTALEAAQAVAVGPGWGTWPGAAACLERLVAVDRPLVMDADALNLVAADPALAGRVRDRFDATVITPHPGEAGRLLCVETSAIQEDREAAAAALADRHGCVAVLKGAGTLVSDGQRTERVATGNPGMATAGSGDVLTGVVAAFAARGLDPFDAAWLAAHVHGLAGDLAAAGTGRESLVAGDLLAELPRAMRTLE